MKKFICLLLLLLVADVQAQTSDVIFADGFEPREDYIFANGFDITSCPTNPGTLYVCVPNAPISQPFQVVMGSINNLFAPYIVTNGTGNQVNIVSVTMQISSLSGASVSIKNPTLKEHQSVGQTATTNSCGVGCYIFAFPGWISKVPQSQITFDLFFDVGSVSEFPDAQGTKYLFRIVNVEANNYPGGPSLTFTLPDGSYVRTY